MKRLILLRHGQSVWNLENRFTGWHDVDLSDKGRDEAIAAGELMHAAGIAPDALYTSVLTRAIRTGFMGLDVLDRLWVPMIKDWRLNERHYGALTGLDKAETAAQYGDEQVHIWRRSFATPPPALDSDDARHPRHDPRYADLDPARLPATESLKDTLARVLPYWESDLVPALERYPTLLIAAHGNSLRALVKHLEGISDEDITGVEIATGDPLVYELGDDFGVERKYSLRENT
ncbi:2,3-diphosphoglycerate-dependent phosphoglycerate mutase [Spiribacter vilamensis]|uniref:2,3-bisphosphoglycerate-dependent phosphoglycerate mutase n=1 Tax=Spiribacter vilamensis TaxID=531306 RepID=A0A4Q8CZQ8_9GAMM|nr:2,3-diphosphoglycerate-dependent phosphoglycerate mutase [Spiribacter vilamensis]RZU98503.1 phosphoglycerate mutase [Spiribacter vilamensis]TVO60631.1 2,3-diphosphoglycerate-dependent phosphoglycerate mutase [Spiribacter vilamensis]